MSASPEVDVVCVGSGIGGCAAAATAARLGARVLLVEKAAKVGGVTAYSGGQVWIPGTRQQAALGIEDTVESGAAYLEEVSGGWGDHERTLSLLRGAREALEYFEAEHGFGMQVIKDLPDYVLPAFPARRRQRALSGTHADRHATPRRVGAAAAAVAHRIQRRRTRPRRRRRIGRRALRVHG